MIFLNLIPLLFKRVNSSKDGVVYSEDKGTLISTPVDLINYKIPKECKIISGGDSPMQSSFLQCIHNIKTITDDVGSQLMCIYPYVFTGSSLSTIDLRHSSSLTAINYSVFKSCNSLTTVFLPEGLKVICSGSFAYSEALESISIPDSVGVIEGWELTHDSSFKNCKSLKKVTLTEASQLNYTGGDAFAGTGLTSFYIPEKAKGIEKAIFNTKIVDISIHKNNQNYSFDKKALFSHDKKIIYFLIYNEGMEYSVPSSVTEFGGFGFRQNNITKITFNSNVKYWASFCFQGAKFEEFVMPEGSDTVPKYFLAYCNLLRTITLPSSIKYVREYAFSYCPLLTSIQLSDKIEIIESWAFCECTSLENFVCPKSLYRMEDGVFSGAPQVIFVKNGNQFFDIVDNILYCNDTIAQAHFGTSTRVVIKESCNKISGGVFSSQKVQEIDIRSTSSLSINKYSFSDTKIVNIVLPANTASTDYRSFFNNSVLETVTIPQDAPINTISQCCFELCYRLETITLSKNIVTISDEAFKMCNRLTNIDFSITKLQAIGKRSFLATNVGIVNLPSTLTKLDEECFANSFITQLNMQQNSLNEINVGAFSNCNKLSSITFSDSIQYINKFAFFNCTSLKEVTFPLNINTICSRSFTDCTELKSITLKCDCMLQEIEGEVFKGCFNLDTINIDKNDKKFLAKDGVLMDKEMTNLMLFAPGSKTTVFVIPYTVKNIQSYAFQDCKNLRSLTIPDGFISSVGYRSFEGCVSLESLFLPEKLQEFGNDAFLNCINLKCGSVTYPHGNIELAIAAGIPRYAFDTDCPKNECQTCKNTHANYLSAWIAAIFIINI